MQTLVNKAEKFKLHQKTQSQKTNKRSEASYIRSKQKNLNWQLDTQNTYITKRLTKIDKLLANRLKM